MSATTEGLTPARAAAEVEQPLSVWEKLYLSGAARKTFVVVSLALVWELYARWLDNTLMFPTLTETLIASWRELVTGALLPRIGSSLRVLGIGYAIGFTLAVLVTIAATSSLIARDYLTTLTSMLSPLPAIALLPVALI